jgi:hypothetical protein
LQIKTVKYDADQEITIMNENLRKIKSQFFANICLHLVQLENLLVYRYSDLTSLINGKYVFGPSQIFGKFELTFKLQNQR